MVHIVAARPYKVESGEISFEGSCSHSVTGQGFDEPHVFRSGQTCIAVPH
jgi:hypothetical protein